ncbi:hypothetical protein Tco_0526870 [Tanacetum coccineum]
MGSHFTELEVLRSSPHIGNHAICYLLMTIGEYVKNIDLLSLIEDEVCFTSLSDSDSIRVCLLLSLEVIFMGHDLGSAIVDVFLRTVEDLEDWNDFPWGEHMWRELYAAIRNVNSNHKQVHHKALEINPNFVPTYSLYGFVLCFKIWILESSSVTDRWWTKDSEGIPRGCFWSKHFPFQKWEYFGKLFPQDKKPNYELYPNRAEAQSEWFTRSSDYFKMYTLRAPPVEYGGLFGDVHLFSYMSFALLFSNVSFLGKFESLENKGALRSKSNVLEEEGLEFKHLSSL